MQECKKCKKNKDYCFYSKDKYYKSGYKSICKGCERNKRNHSRKNLNNINDAQEWLNENFPQYEILSWGNKEKSVILDKERNVQFDYVFFRFKDKLKQNPNRTFSPSNNELQNKIKQSMQEKYGVEHGLQNEKILKKVQNTYKQKTGFDNPMKNPKIKEKFKQVYKEKTGFENPNQNPEIREKIEQTNLQRYGHKYTYQSPLVREKGLNSYKEKTGYQHPMHNPDSIKKLIQTRVKNGSIKLYDGKTQVEWAKELDLPTSTFNQYLNKFGFDMASKLNKKSKSSLELIIEEFLIENNLVKDTDFICNKKLPEADLQPDFLLNDSRLIIECDGLLWHSDGNPYYAIPKDHHKKRKEKYQELGYKSMFFRADELESPEKFNIVKSIILNKLGKSKRIFARKTDFVNIKDGDFFKKNHLMGPGSGRIYALKYKEEIVCAIQVKWINKEEKVLEISRFSPKTGINVVGGFSKLLKNVIKKECPNKIVTFIDKRYGEGAYLSDMGFVKTGEHISFKWTDTKNTYHRLRFRNNSGYEKGLFKIWDCGQAKWELIINV